MTAPRAELFENVETKGITPHHFDLPPVFADTTGPSLPLSVLTDVPSVDGGVLGRGSTLAGLEPPSSLPWD